MYFCGVRQTAVVPADAKSLTFEAGIGGIFGTGSFEITVNSSAVTYFPIGQTNGLTSFAIDVRQLAGKTNTLSFAAKGRGDGCQVSISNVGLDNLRFVSDALVPVPNPTLEWHPVGEFFIQISYTGVLQQADTADGEFIDVQGAYSPYYVHFPSGSGAFFRTRN